MKTNNIFSILLLAVATLVLSGCSDWLDYTPKDKTTAEQQFSTRAGFYTAVNGVYNRLASTTLYGNTLSYGAIDLMGQRYEAGTNQYSPKYLWSGFKYTNSTLQSSLNYVWQEAYQTILNANVILQGVDEQKGVLSDIDKNLIKGDLLALRAFLHFDMLRLFGTVYSQDSKTAVIPYNDSTEPKAYDLLSSKEIVYDHLLPDLNAAEQCLKAADPIQTVGVTEENNDDNDNYRSYRQMRLNYFAVALLKARVYQWLATPTTLCLRHRR